MERLNCGESKTIFRNISCIVIIGLTSSGRASWQEEDTRKIKYCTDSSGAILYLRALQGHSGRSLMDPSLPDNVIIPNGFFKYIYHVRCAINLNSIIDSGLIPGRQNLSNRQTIFFCLWIEWTKNKDPDTIDLEAPRLAHYMQKELKNHEDTVHWVDIKLAQKKALKFFHTRTNAIIVHETFPAYCIPKIVRMETGKLFTKSSSKDFFAT